MVITFHLKQATADQYSVPAMVGGFSLNTSVDDYNLDKHAHYLDEIILFGIEGFKMAYITYGKCENPGKILRIKLKYEDQSYEFFEKLLWRYKQLFGKKPEFSGDVFGNVKTWRWTFMNDDNQRINLTLQHNLKVTDESVGNMVILSLPEKVTVERECFLKKRSPIDSKVATKTEPNWELLIPR